MEKFYRFLWFRKVDILGRNFENFENLRKNDNYIEGGAPALRVIRAGTRLTVHRSLPFRVAQGGQSRGCLMERASLYEPPSGNQVDGLPPASSDHENFVLKYIIIE